MRLRVILPAVLLIALLAGAGATGAAAHSRDDAFVSSATALRMQWDQQQRDGVPASSLAALRADLASHQPTAAWWSPAWFSNDGQSLLAGLRTRTESVWNAAMAGARAQAQQVIDQWSTFAVQQTAWLASDVVGSAAEWPQELAAARTPAQLNQLAGAWQATVTQQRQAVTAAQQAKLAAELQSAGGPDAVLATARRLVSIARDDNLDAGNVATLADQLSSAIANATDPTTAGGQLLTAVNTLQALVDLNNQVSGQVRPLYLLVLQAQGEGTPSASAFTSQYQALSSQFRAARGSDQLSAAGQALSALQAQVNAELNASQCGHAVGSGKVITINLTLQEMVFYEDGCVARATPVSTGRPQLRTPTGTFHIFNKQSPFKFISPWPPSSPFYYFPSDVQWVMEFADGGYFIHDAPWESIGEYGPGSEDNPSAASHGCVHVPTSVMGWAYTWASPGTPVIITS